MNTNAVPASALHLVAQMRARLAQRPKLATLFEHCFLNTLQTTVRPQPDGTTFVITGDIPAMWLRDSAAQVRPYLILAPHDPQISDMLAGVVRLQLRHVLHDPYANAFNESANGQGHTTDITDMGPLVWERKYEIDSLCAPIALAYLLWKATGRTDHLDDVFRSAAEAIIALWRREQFHGPASPYRFTRLDCPPSDTLHNDGLGAPVAPTGMTWSGFRPSDDACTYGYLAPANMFAIVSLQQLAEIAGQVLNDPPLRREALMLAGAITGGIQTYATVEHPRFGTIYAYETDGNGNYNLMDDANVPSLLSLPYLGYCPIDDPIYCNTRQFVLSDANPYFFSGSAAQGVGSPHTPDRYIWHIALAMQGLTTHNQAERAQLLQLFETTDAGTNLMHEGFSVDNPTQFTRPWFSWANSMFCEFLLDCCGITVPSRPLAPNPPVPNL